MFYKLKSINIELTNRCNLNCKMCYRNRMVDSEGIMEDSVFEKIVTDLCEIDEVDTVYLHWRGEPTITKNLPERIELIKSKLNCQVVLFTNGTLLEKDQLFRVMSAGLDVINFSLDANSQNAYEKIRGADYFDKVCSNILLADSIRKENDYLTRIYIYGVVLENNMMELLKLKQNFEGVVDEIYLKYDMRNESMTQGITTEKCKWPFTNILIGWDGEAAPCCIDVNHEYKLGNVKDITVKELFNGDRITALRGQIERGEKNLLCENCSFCMDV